MSSAIQVALVQPASAMSGAARSSSAVRARTAAAAVRPRTAAAALCVQRSSSRAAARRSAVCVRAVLNVTDDTFEEEVLEAPVPVLVDFWANWCGPCRLMHPMMDWAEKEYGSALKVVKVEADGNTGSIEKYKVYGLPCFILFKDGQEVEGSHSEGAMTKKALGEYLQKHLGLVPAPAKA
ncbi:hypothetical protein ABPG75_003621 [Micractinium tetrahymenae]